MWLIHHCNRENFHNNVNLQLSDHFLRIRDLIVIFRKITDLFFICHISKLIEKVALTQINSYLCQNNLFPKCQSAYRKGHSTETALLQVQNDVLLSLDMQNDVILVLLDLSAAFDTIDHNILLHRLCCRFQITGIVFEWIKSYLQRRTQQVRIGSVV